MQYMTSVTSYLPLWTWLLPWFCCFPTSMPYFVPPLNWASLINAIFQDENWAYYFKYLCQCSLNTFIAIVYLDNFSPTTHRCHDQSVHASCFSLVLCCTVLSSYAYEYLHCAVKHITPSLQEPGTLSSKLHMILRFRYRTLLFSLPLVMLVRKNKNILWLSSSKNLMMTNCTGTWTRCKEVCKHHFMILLSYRDIEISYFNDIELLNGIACVDWFLAAIHGHDAHDCIKTLIKNEIYFYHYPLAWDFMLLDRKSVV